MLPFCCQASSHTSWISNNNEMPDPIKDELFDKSFIIIPKGHVR